MTLFSTADEPLRTSGWEAGYFCECHKGFVFNEEIKACMGKINNPSS